MKVAVVVFVVGEKYISNFNNTFKQPLESYCNKHSYDLIVLTELLRYEEIMCYKKFLWQKMLIPEKFNYYDFVVVMDADIYINSSAPPLPLTEIPPGKVGAVNERKYFGNYEWRERVQIKHGWERTGKDWYAISGEDKPYHDHMNSGVVIYQPKYHADMITKLYNDNILDFDKYHQGDQSILSIFLMDNDLIHWIDERYNRVWIFWKELMYPNFDSLSIDHKKIYVHNFIELNYFTHFTSHHCVEYI